MFSSDAAMEQSQSQSQSQSGVEERFSNFYDKWMSKLEHLVRLLLLVSRQSLSQEEDTNNNNNSNMSCEQVVDKLTLHHKEYYTFKWAAARDDVLAFFGPLWLTPLENAFLWFTGWKPSTAFRLLDSLPATPTDDHQARRIQALRARIKLEEDRVEREMERQQVAMAGRPMVELSRMEGEADHEGIVEAAVKGLLAGLERVMKMADCVRLKTLKGLLEVLTPMQSVNFLAASSMLLLHLRKWGKRRSAVPAPPPPPPAHSYP